MSDHPKKSLPPFFAEALSYGTMIFLAGGIAWWGVMFISGALSTRMAKAEPDGAASAVAASEPAPATEAAAPAAAPATASAPSSAPAVAAQPDAATSAPAPAAAAGGGDLHSVGQQVYSTVCIACHQPTGMGLPNMFPPLGGSDWVNAEKPDRMIRIVLHGFTGPFKLNGNVFNSPAPLMPPQGAALSDLQIAGVLTHVRSSFGNKAGEVTPGQVKAIREAEKARTAMWTEAELDKVSPLN